MGKGGSVSVREGAVMPEDAPGNPGAVRTDAQPAGRQAAQYRKVREMQAKLHRWAGEDRSRRFGDLFNLVSDLEFLAEGWLRVKANAGSKTPGIDKATVADIENGCGSFEVSWLRCEDMAVAVSGVVDAFVLAAEVEAPVVLEVAGGDEGAELEDGLGAFESPSCARYVHSVLDDVPAGPFYDPGGDGPAFPQRGGVVQVVLLVLQVAGAF